MFFRLNVLRLARVLVVVFGFVMLCPSSRAVDREYDPENLWAGIEVGGSGVKAVVLHARSEGGTEMLTDINRGNSVKEKQLVEQSHLTSKMNGKSFDKDQIDRSVAAVRKLGDIVKKEYKVPPAHIYVAASSGVATRGADNYTVLEKRIGELGFVLGQVSAEEEVRFTFLGMLPAPTRAERDNALVIDIGGSNIKFGYVTEDKPGNWRTTTSGSVLYGSNVLETTAKDNLKERLARAGSSTEFIEELKTLRTTVVEPKLIAAIKEFQEEKEGKLQAERKAKGLPASMELRKRKVYLCGGASFVMAVLEKRWPPEKENEPEDQVVPITPELVDDLYLKLRDKEWDIDKIPGNERWREALKDMKDAFRSSDRRIAASELLKAVYDAFELGKDREVVYVPNSHLVWIRGYVEARRLAHIGKVTPVTQDSVDDAVAEIKGELIKTRSLAIHSSDAEERFRKELMSRVDEVASGVKTLVEIEREVVGLARGGKKSLDETLQEVTKAGAQLRSLVERQEMVLGEANESRKSLAAAQGDLQRIQGQLSAIEKAIGKLGGSGNGTSGGSSGKGGQDTGVSAQGLGTATSLNGRARFSVTVPTADAILYVDGVPDPKSNVLIHEFMTPTLASGVVYQYTFRVEYMDGGVRRVRVRKVQFRSDTDNPVVIQREAETAAVR
jgi:uncharacterized protein (TIGR03000 family)